MTAVTSELPTQFDPNVPEAGLSQEGTWRASFPKVEQPALTVAHYADAFAPMIKSSGVMDWIGETMKGPAIGAAPGMSTFGSMSTLTGDVDQNLSPWPDLPPMVLRKLAAENLIIHAVVQQRSLDVDRYAGRSTHLWKPGWTIEVRNKASKTSKQDLVDIQEAARFIENCGLKTGWDARSRDASDIQDFRTYLKCLVRDSLRYDLGATWTSCDTQGRVEAFKAIPGANIKLATREGYKGVPAQFAVGVDEAGTVKHIFTRESLALLRRNPRTDSDSAGYGYSEISMTLKVIQAFTNAFDMNADTFTRSSVPNGILTGTGMWTPRQTEVLSRMWQNLKKGVTKQWALPFIGLPKDGELKVLDLSAIKGNEVYYQDFINMMGGLYCAIVGFPPDRLGYRISGRGPDSSPSPASSSNVLIDQADPGLPGLLEPIEEHINNYLIAPRWPQLILRFNGKNPKEDARSYEFRRNASTLGEARAMADLPSLADAAKGPEQKKIAELMELCPIDAGLTGVFQSLVQAMLGGEGGEGGAPAQPGAKIVSKKDPAASEQHGHASGVRRDSAGEAKRAAAAKKSVGFEKPLYVQRKVLNPEPILAWANAQGFKTTLEASDLHVTVAYSREAVDWFAAGTSTSSVEVPAGGPRAVMRLGSKAVVLRFDSLSLMCDWQRFLDAGASWDHDGYSPHMTWTYEDGGVDLDSVQPYQGEILLGPELFSALDPDWADKVRVRHA